MVLAADLVVVVLVVGIFFLWLVGSFLLVIVVGRLLALFGAVLAVGIFCGFDLVFSVGIQVDLAVDFLDAALLHLAIIKQLSESYGMQL